MPISSTALLCYGAIPELAEAGIRPTRDPPPGRAGDRADAMLLLVQDRDRIAGDLNGLVVRRLFSAGDHASAVCSPRLVLVSPRSKATCLMIWTSWVPRS